MYYDPQFQNVTKTEPWRKVLRNAADLIERVGWVQHCNGNETIGICAQMALRISCYTVEFPRHSHLEMAYCHLHRSIGESIPDWNDRDGQTKENVTAQLRACADA